MGKNGGSDVRVVAQGPVKRVLAAIALSALLCPTRPAHADSFATLFLSVVVVDVIIPVIELEAPLAASSLDFMTLPVVVDGKAATIESLEVLSRPLVVPFSAPGALRVAAQPLASGEITDFVSTGTVIGNPVGQNYYKGAVLLPADAYLGGAVDYFVRVVLRTTPSTTQTFYLGLNGQRADDYVNLTPFSTSFDPRPNFLVDASGGDGTLNGDPRGTNAGVIFPAGAVSGPSQLWVEQLDPTDSTRVPLKDGAAPISAYEFESDVRRFNKPIDLVLRYPDIDGTPGVVDGTGLNENSLRVFWWDGFDWRLMGGAVNPVNNVVTAKTNHFSLYGLFPAVTGAPPAAACRPLEKILTPNGDNSNDAANFSSGSCSLTGTFEIKIFDPAGRLVRTIQPPALAEWDGRDDDGDLVESGVYVYQFRSDTSAEWISGMIGVAK